VSASVRSETRIVFTGGKTFRTKTAFYIYLSVRYVTASHSSRTVFARSDAWIVGSNPTQGMDVWCVYAFILCLCCPVFMYRPCDGLITCSRSPTVCEK
jgi:hypothetical protein